MSGRAAASPLMKHQYDEAGLDQQQSELNRLTMTEEAVKKRVESPFELEPEVQVVWDRIVDSLPSGWFETADVWVLVTFCQIEVEYQELRFELLVEGHVLKDHNDKAYINPLVTILNGLRTHLMRMATDLRLNPRIRSAYRETKDNTVSKSNLAKDTALLRDKAGRGKLLAIAGKGRR